MGTPSSNGTAPLIHPGGGPMSGCCCGAECNSSSACLACNGDTPNSIAAVVSGVSVCAAGCYLIVDSAVPANRQWAKVMGDMSARVNGTWCIPKVAASNCNWSSQTAAANQIRVYGGASASLCDEVGFAFSESNYNYLLTIAWTGTQAQYSLGIGVGGSNNNLFAGTALITPSAEPRRCYQTITIPNALVQRCAATSPATAGGLWAAGGSATITPCCL